MAYYAAADSSRLLTPVRFVCCFGCKMLVQQRPNTHLALPREDLTGPICKAQKDRAAVADNACSSCGRLHSNAMLEENVNMFNVLHASNACSLQDRLLACVHAVYMKVVVVCLHVKIDIQFQLLDRYRHAQLLFCVAYQYRQKTPATAPEGLFVRAFGLHRLFRSAVHTQPDPVLSSSPYLR